VSSDSPQKTIQKTRRACLAAKNMMTKDSIKNTKLNEKENYALTL
jgi:hypothetical protein